MTLQELKRRAARGLRIDDADVMLLPWVDFGLSYRAVCGLLNFGFATPADLPKTNSPEFRRLFQQMPGMGRITLDEICNHLWPTPQPAAMALREFSDDALLEELARRLTNTRSPLTS